MVILSTNTITKNVNTLLVYKQTTSTKFEKIASYKRIRIIKILFIVWKNLLPSWHLPPRSKQ